MNSYELRKKLITLTIVATEELDIERAVAFMKAAKYLPNQDFGKMTEPLLKFGSR